MAKLYYRRVERVARALCRAEGNDPDAKCLRAGVHLVYLQGLAAGARYAPEDWRLTPVWTLYAPVARVALRPLLRRSRSRKPRKNSRVDMGEYHDEH